MIEDRELDAWREHWSSVAKPTADFQRDFQRKVRQRIKLEDRRFVLGNLLTVIAFLGILIFALGHAASIELDGNRMGNRHLRLGFRIGRSSYMGFAANVASRDTVNPCVRGTLVQKSGGSNSAASDLYLFVYRLAYFLCGTYGC